jgi:tetratricopeptide (TPR) repeat protein
MDLKLGDVPMIPTRAPHVPETTNVAAFSSCRGGDKAVIVPSVVISQLGKRLSAVVSKRPSLAACLWGAPGIGKTHTAKLLLQQTPCHHITVHATIPIRTLLSVLPQTERLSAWVEASLENLDRGATPVQTATALCAWLSALAPFVLHIEDLHEARPERQGLWGHLAQAIQRTRGLGLIVTSRTPPPETFESVQLESLDRDASRALLEGEAGASLPVEALDWIFDHTQGNPLYTLEYYRYLTRLGHLWSDGQHWRWNAPKAGVMPASVEAVIAQMIETALNGDETRSALETRAMLGLETTEDIWAAVSGLSLEHFRAAQLDLELHGILRGTAFVHPLFHEVARGMLSPDERRRIARKAIEVLQDDSLRAATFVEEAELPSETARPLLEKAMLAARAAGNERQVAELLVKTVTHSSEADRGRVLLEASDAMTKFSLTEGERLASLAVQAQPENAKAVIWHARLLISLNRANEARTMIERLSDEIMPQTARWLTMIELKGLRDPQWILEVWNAHPEVREAANAAVRRQVAIALYDLGDTIAARAAFQDVLKIPELPVYERVGALNVLAQIERDAGEFDQSERTFSQALEVIEQNLAPAGLMRLTELQVTAWNATIFVNRAVVYRRQGSLHRAVQDAESGVALFAQVGSPHLYAAAQVGLAELLIHLGEYKRAEGLLQEAQIVVEGRLYERVTVGCDLANLYLEWDAPYARALALKHARDAERRAQTLSDLEAKMSALHVAGWAEALYGQPARALEHALALETISGDVNHARAMTLCRWVRALALERLGQHDDAADTLREALESATASKLDLLETERIGLELDRITQDIESARERVSRARGSGNLNLVNLAGRFFSSLEPTPNAALEDRAASRKRLELLGPMTVDGQPISERTRKGRELLALLLEARVTGRRDVPQLELLDALYPDLIEDKAVGALRQLVFRVRASLGPDAILRGAGGYALGAVDTDVERFLETRDPGLWRGAYLQDIGAGWDSSLRETLHDTLREVMTELLELDPHEVARLGKIVLESDPYDREALKLSLRALRVTGDEAGLNRLYKRSRTQFEEIGEPLPEDWNALLEIPAEGVSGFRA